MSDARFDSQLSSMGNAFFMKGNSNVTGLDVNFDSFHSATRNAWSRPWQGETHIYTSFKQPAVKVWK